MTIPIAAPARWRLAVPAAVAVGAAMWLPHFPVQPLLLGLFYLAALALVLWNPALLFTLVLAALPLGLSPWSGRHGIDEFDVLMAITCAAAWARLPSHPNNPADRRTLMLAASLLLVLCVGAGRSLWPWPGLHGAEFAYPLDAFSSLRIAKGGLWALVLFLLARSWQVSGADVHTPFANGMILGLSGVVLCIVAERLAFTGLTDFAADYRVSGPFPAMSLGGAYVEAFLVAGIPFLVLKLLPPASPWQQLPGAVLLVGAIYSLAVTFSRGGYAALAASMLTLGSALAIAPGEKPRRRMLAFAVLAALMASVTYPVLSGSFAKSRMKSAEADLDVRERHWAEGLQTMDDTLTARWLGMGLGSFPSVRFWSLPSDRRPGGHQLLTDNDGTPVLRLGAGTSYFFEQIVPARPGERYRYQIVVRNGDLAAAPSPALCQKWIIASFDCGRLEGPATFEEAPGEGWHKLSQTIVAPSISEQLLPRPHRLSLRNGGDRAIDIASVSLTATAGTELVRNGRFADGLDHWTITSDDHLAWHIHSMPLGLYFELGMLGAAAAAVLLASSIWRSARAAITGHRAGAALLAAVSGFVVIGLFDSLIDEPRFLMLWLVLCLWAQLLPGQPAISRSLRSRRMRPA